MTREKAMLKKVIEDLKKDRAFMSSVSHWEVLPAKDGDYLDFPEEIDQRLLNALSGRGITRLYSHQHETYLRARQGKNVVLVTPTASGKTLAYNLPVLQTLLEAPEARAMYLFPTKALSQDQQAELNEILLGGSLPVHIYTYDGDTPRSVRISVREEGRVVITNPDMLHTGVLPNHPKWLKFFKALRFVVIDEIHTYRGVLGSHLTNLIRRLKRIAAFYGSSPLFICCSATIGNPLELARNIIEEEAVLIDNNGSPAGERHFILYNPPLVDPVQGIRRGVVPEAQRISSRLLKSGIKTIVFARSRVRTELIATYIRNSLSNIYNDNHRIRVASYRGGYLPKERRRIEQGLRNNTIQGVVSTNALELGIDIGGLDASILAGFPGSIASAWQQAGRAGRRSTLSLSILVASASAIDQYLIRHPEYFFGRSPESGWVDGNNIFILADQLKCAVFELPFSLGEEFTEGAEELLKYLEENGVVRFTHNKWFWADRSYPAEGVSLRSAAPGNIVIVDTTKGKNEVIGEMDKPSAKMMIFDEAVYLHLGNQYIVRKLELEKQRCYVEETAVNYYTDSIVKTDIKLLHEDQRESRGGFDLVLGDILVRTQTAKYKKLKFHTNENVGYGNINLPAEEMHTRTAILLMAENSPAGKSLDSLPEEEQVIVLQKLATLVRNVAPVFLLCDLRDIRIAERFKDPAYGCCSIYVYDSYPGGTGLSEGLVRNIADILNGCRELVEGCSCEAGCPSCIGPTQGVLHFNPKHRVKEFLAGWL
jgi:DEAD/DEAH box helicase domain-containing protein